MLRLLTYLAAVVALAALGAAVGDFASDPSPLGAVGLILLVTLIGAAFARLFGPRGPVAMRSARAGSEKAPPPREEPGPAPPAKRRRPSTRPTSAPLWLDRDDQP